MAEPLHLTREETVVIVREEDGVLEVEGTWGPGGSPPPGHFHPAQDEAFTVLEGALTFRIDGETRSVTAGSGVEIPCGTVHQVWNAGATTARARWETRPAGRTAEWFRAVDAAHRSDRVGADGSPSLLAFGVPIAEFDDVFRLAGPQPLVRSATALLGVAGRLRGYRVNPG
jgi:quercetin dioxygenase-like cupin family protein